MTITVEERPDWDVDRMVQWWDETTAGANLAGPGANLAGSAVPSPASSGAQASPTASAQAAAAAAPATVAGLPYLMRSFARPWWGDLKGCTPDVRSTFTSFYPVPPIGVMIESMHMCELRDGWQQAGGFDKIMFVSWENRMFQRKDHDETKKVYGADQLRDQPGLAGPKSGMFMVKDVTNHCIVYWDDEAVAVAAWVFAPCRKNPKTTPASITAFWNKRV